MKNTNETHVYEARKTTGELRKEEGAVTTPSSSTHPAPSFSGAEQTLTLPIELDSPRRIA